MPDLKDLAEKIEQRRALRERSDWEQVRRAAGLSRKELADYLGVTVQSVYYWEKHQREPRGKHADDYAAAISLLRSLI